ncbi:MAG: c-type cytochrome [Planctomycetota bacterium]
MKATRRITFIALVPVLLVLGCTQEVPIDFEPNLVFVTKHQIKEGFSMDQASKDATWIVTKMFGTADEPKLPDFTVMKEDEPEVVEDLTNMIDLDHLRRAAGAPGEGRGLYREHCSKCHGVSGDGRGSLSAVMTPYPRDYRKGVFKFKSTKRGSKPTREDIAYLIRNGVAGTSMVKIPALTDEDIQALTDYVIYLSWRGELERSVIDDAVFELDLTEDRLINPDFANSPVEEEKEAFDEAWAIAEEIALDIGANWFDASDDVVEVPEPPESAIVTDSREEFVKLMESDKADQLVASVKRGGELFRGKIASCSKCHGKDGLGDGQNTDYDEWTKEWTTAIGLDPTKQETLVPLMARGALPPRNAKPRNLSEGIFHGGGSAETLYRRITQGIAGSPMPAATFVEGQFEQEDVWHLINFIRSLQKPEEESDLTKQVAAR